MLTSAAQDERKSGLRARSTGERGRETVGVEWRCQQVLRCHDRAGLRSGQWSGSGEGLMWGNLSPALLRALTARTSAAGFALRLSSSVPPIRRTAPALDSCALPNCSADAWQQPGWSKTTSHGRGPRRPDVISSCASHPARARWLARLLLPHNHRHTGEQPHRQPGEALTPFCLGR